MDRGFTLGLMSLPPTWDEAKLHANWAESLQFDSLWTGDHLRHPRHPDQPFLDGWSVLAAWAATTSRVRLGMLVSNLIYRNPAVIARQAAAIGVIANGRMVLGLGTGVYSTDHAMAGVAEWSAGERVARLDECVQIVDRLLRGELLTFNGVYYRPAEAIVRPLPPGDPRMALLVGALRRRTIAIAVRRADIWNTWAGFVPTAEAAVEAVRSQCELVGVECARQQRDPSSLQRSLCMYPPLDPWSSPTELERLIDTFLPMGITGFVVYPPAPDKEALFLRAAAAVLT